MQLTPASAIRQAARRLRRAPAFTVAAVLTLALGIGATTAVFSVVDGVLLRPLPFDDAERLVDLSHTLVVSGPLQVDQSDATFLYYRRANHVFTGVAAYRTTGASLGALRDGSATTEAAAERVEGARVSADAFGVLRVAPLHGRGFTIDEERPDAAPVVVIGERLWARRFGADPSIVGRRVDVDGVPRTVVGIMPGAFRWPDAGTQLWLPIQIDPAHTATAAFDFRAVARLRPGITLERAAADLQRLLPEVPVAYPGRLTTAAIEQTRMRAVVRPLRDVVVGDIGRVLWVVLGAVGFVLLVACANVANLFLVRAEGRHQELAVRRALGAGRGAITLDLLVEALLLALAGGVIGLALAVAGLDLLRALPSSADIPRIEEIGLRGAGFAVAAGASILAAMFVSLIPALRSAALSPAAALTGGRSATAGRVRNRARQALVLAQVALALVLLSGAGLMARSFARLRAVVPGFDASHAYVFRVALPDAGYPAPTDPARYAERAMAAMGALPGVRTVGVSTKLPLLPEARQDTALFVEDRPLAPGTLPNLHQVTYASPELFASLGVPLVAGRTLDRLDPSRAPREVVVSRALAERYWPGGSAIGRRVRTSPTGPWFTIVGVAGDVRGTALESPPDEMIYLPLVIAPRAAEGSDPAVDAGWSPRTLAFVVRSDGDPAVVAAAAERAVRGLDPSVPIFAARGMTDVLRAASARTSFTLLLLAIASAVALALGAVGIYGVMSYVVSLRARELAVRLALGAEPAEVRTLVTRQGAALAVLGTGLGLAGALAATRVLAALLYGVSPLDPVALLGAASLLFAVALVATWLPARRAAALDPADALRVE
jgi:putative ABC transport system permease protein